MSTSSVLTLEPSGTQPVTIKWSYESGSTTSSIASMMWKGPPKIEIKEFLLFERSLDCITGEKIFNITFASTTNDKTLALTNFLSQPKHHLKGAVWIYTGDSSLGILMFYSDRMKWFRGFFGTQEEAFSWGRPTSSCAALMDVRYQTLPEPAV